MTTVLKTPFLYNTFGLLLLRLVEYLFLEAFFCFFGEISFALLQMFNIEIFRNFFTVVQKNIFCFLSDFAWNFIQ